MSGSGEGPIHVLHGPVHVLHVLRMGRPGGGMERGVINVANALPEEFRTTLCLLEDEDGFSERLRRADAKVIREPKRGAGIDWGLIPRLARLFRAERPDLVFSHNWGTFLYAALAAKLSGVPVLHGEHGKNIEELGEANRFKHWAKRLLGPRLDHLVTVSEPIRTEWMQLYGVARGRTTCIPNGVNTERFTHRRERAECRARFGLAGEAFVVGSVSRLDPIKNYGALLEAMAILRRTAGTAQLVLAGDGPCLEDLRRKAAAEGIEQDVRFLGRRDDVEHLLPALDVFVLPSFSEGMPNTVIEAMACGAAVVCSRVPGHEAVVDDGESGLLVGPPCDGARLGEALITLAGNETLRARLSRGAVEKVERCYTLERMIGDYAELYRGCARGARRQRRR